MDLPNVANVDDCPRPLLYPPTPTKKENKLKYSVTTTLYGCLLLALLITGAVAGTSSPWRPFSGPGTGLACGQSAADWICDSNLGLCDPGAPGVTCMQNCRFDANGNIIGVACNDSTSTW